MLFQSFSLQTFEHDLQHFNEVHQLKDLKKQQKYQEASSSEVYQPV